MRGRFTRCLVILCAWSLGVAARAQAPFPFFEGFESGALSSYWQVVSTPGGRVSVTNYGPPYEGQNHVILDSTNSYARNELILTIDLAGQTSVYLNCWAMDFADDANSMPSQFAGSTNADGIAISADGTNWHRLAALNPTYTYTYTNLSADLSALAASRGLTLNSQFKIKVQQYDNYPVDTDGWGFDNIQVFDRSQSADVSLRLTDSIDPVTVSNILTYSLTVSNAGPRSATNVVVTNFIPFGVELISASAGQGTWTTNGSLLAFDLGAVASGGVAAITIAVKPLLQDLLYDVASVSCPLDRLLGNNAAFETTWADFDGGDLRFTAASIAAEEGQGIVQITVVRTNHIAGAVSFDYTTVDGSATAGSDFIAGTGTVILVNGQTSASWDIALVNDQAAEAAESFSVAISNPTGGAQLASPSNLTVNVRDEDGVAAFPFSETFESGALSNYWTTYSTFGGHLAIVTNEGPHGGSLHVLMDSTNFYDALNEMVLTADLSGREGVHLRFWHKRLPYEYDDTMANTFTGHAFADGVSVSTDGTNWYKVHGLAASQAGTNEYREFDIPLDPILAAHGLSFTNRFRVKFQQYDYYYAPYIGRLFDDIALFALSGDVRFSSPDWSAGEESGAVTLTVERVSGDAGQVTVDFATSNGTAQAGADYTATNGTLVFANGVKSQIIVVPILSDGDDETLETFTLLLTNATGGAAVVSPALATVTILDDDGPGEFHFGAAFFAESEDSGLASIPIDRLYGTQGTATVYFRTQAGTAAADVDFTSTTGSVEYTDGAVRHFIEIPLINDAFTEGPETVLLFITNAAGAAVGALSNATLTILDDETPRAPFPFHEGFESGVLSNYWSLRTTGLGRITFSTNEAFEAVRHLAMDAASGSALNEAVLTVDLAGQSSVIFRCWTRTFADAAHAMPTNFSGSTNADGIAVSVDGLQWHRLATLPTNSSVSAYTNIVVDLAAFAAQRGLPLTATFQIKFQQFDSGALTNRGRAFDHISLIRAPATTGGVLRAQGFEGGTNDTWDFHSVPRTGQIALRTERAYSGTRSLRMTDAAALNSDPFIVFDNVDISFLNNVYVTVAFSASGPDSNDDLFLDLSYDNGATWTGAGSVKLIDGFSNAEVPFGGTNASNPTTVASNPYTVSLPGSASQVKVRVRFDEASGTSGALDSYYVDHIILGYSPSNQPPQLSGLGDRAALVSNRLDVVLVADDTDHDVITLSASNLPPNATFDTVVGAGPVSNVFSFLPDVSQADAVYLVTFRAEDDDGEDVEALTVRVLDRVVSFSTSRIATAEGNGNPSLVVSLSRPLDAVVQLASSGYAQLGTNGDFTLSSTNLVFTAAGPKEQTIALGIRDDALAEGPETAVILVTNSPDVVLGASSCDLLVRDNDSMTIASANLTSGGSFLYQAPGQRILQSLQPDIVAIQEFNVPQGGGHRQFVDENFGTNYSFYVEPGSGIPNGIISRWPIVATGEWADAQVGDRDFAWATIDVPGARPLHVVSVHLHYSGGSSSREIEARELTNQLAQAGFQTNDYIVLCGDLNTQDRNEMAVQVLTTVLKDDRKPADQYGDTDTNQNRDKPYDYVLPAAFLNDRHQALRFGDIVFPEGLVYDTRLWSSNGPPTPALASDSAEQKMQHMVAMKLFSLDTLLAILTAPGPGGTITPANPEFEPGTHLEFLVTADAYFYISLLSTNGSSWSPTGQPASLSLAWSNITASGELAASFAPLVATNNVPLWWLVAHQLTNGSFDAEALADQDVDGFSAWQEYIADTDPTNANSRFEVKSVGGSSGHWLTFVSSTARVYVVEYLSDPLWHGDWSSLVAGLAGSNAITTVTDTNGSAYRIYRVKAIGP